jgi:type I restriction enzyme M protein
MIIEKDAQDITWKLFDLSRGIRLTNLEQLDYALNLLFIKYICDLPSTQSTTIPKHLKKLIGKIQWDNFVKASNLGEALDKAVNKIIEANQEFKMILNETEFSKIPERTLNEMISILSNPQIKNNGFGLFSNYAAIAESMIDFEASNQRFGGYYFTPKWVTQLMARLVNPQKGVTIHDPVCGTGGLFVECAKLLSQKDQDFYQPHSFGQEINNQTSKISQINLLLHGLDNFKVQTGDTLRDPKFIKSDNLDQFDVVVANPPLNINDWGYEEFYGNDKLNRFRYGIPPRKNGDFAFIQHIIAAMKPDSGKAVILVSPGVLFRSGVEQDIRAGIIESDLVEAAIVLPANLLYNTNIPLAILVLNRSKRESRANKVLIIDASNEYKKLNRGVNSFDAKNIDDIVEIFNDFEKLDENKSALAKFASLQDIENIRKNDYQLNANRYITAPMIRIDVKEKRLELHSLEIERLQLEDKMDQILEELEKLK